MKYCTRNIGILKLNTDWFIVGLEAWPRCFCRSETFCDISMISELIYVVLLVERVADSSIVTSVPLEGKTFTDFVLLDGKFFDMATGYGFGRMGGHSGRFDILATASDISEDETGFVDVRGKRRRRSTGGTFNAKSDTMPVDYAGQTRLVPTISKSEYIAMSSDEKLIALFDLMTSGGGVHARVASVENSVTAIDKQVNSHTNRLKLLEYKSIDAEARSRRNNLIFRGIDENMNEDDDECERRVLEIIREHLKLGHEPVIQRAHRLGTLKRRRRLLFAHRAPAAPPARPIIVCFRDYKDVDLILSTAYKLSNTKYGINKDFPKEIMDARSKLWPLYKTERERNPRGTVYIGFPAKLVVDKRVVKDYFPDWYTVIRGSRCSLEEPTTENTEPTSVPPPPPPPPPPPQVNDFSAITVGDRSPEHENQPSDMETSADPADCGETLAPQGTPETAQGTKSSDEPEVTPYDKAMLRLLETISNQAKKQPDYQKPTKGKPRSSSIPRSRDRTIENPTPPNVEAPKQANEPTKD